MKEELKQLFFDYLNNSIRVTSDQYTGSIFYIYDKQLIRDRNISSILSIEEDTEYDSKYMDSIIFHKDPKNGCFWIESDIIWSVFSIKLSMSYEQTQAFFKELLSEHDKLNTLTPKPVDSYIPISQRHPFMKDLVVVPLNIVTN